MSGQCALCTSLSLEICCPSSPLWIKPWKRRLYLLPRGQAAGTVGVALTCRAHWDLQFPDLVLDTSWLGTSASHTHLGLIFYSLGSCFTHPFSFGPRSAFAAFRPWISTSTLGRHRKSHKWDAKMDATGTVMTDCPPFSILAQETSPCPLSKHVSGSRGAGMALLGESCLWLLGSHS